MRDRSNAAVSDMEAISRDSVEQSVVRDQSFITSAIEFDKKRNLIALRFPDGTIRDEPTGEANGIHVYKKTEEADGIMKTGKDYLKNKFLGITLFFVQNSAIGGYTYDKVNIKQVPTPKTSRLKSLKEGAEKLSRWGQDVDRPEEESVFEVLDSLRNRDEINFDRG